MVKLDPDLSGDFPKLGSPSCQ